MGSMSHGTTARIVVTGAAGMVGSHVAEQLLARGDAVVGVDNFLTGSPENLATLAERPGFEFVEANVCDPLDVAGPLDAVLHLASPASPRHFESIPLDILRVGGIGVLNTLDLASRHGARFLFASSSEVYGDPAVHPQHEGYTGNVHLRGVRACYDESKRFGEAAVNTYHRAEGLDTRIVRIFNTYGPRMHPYDGRVVSNFIRQAMQGEDITIFGDGKQTRSFCYRDDLVEGIIRMMNGPDEFVGPVNIGNPGEFTIRELAELVVKMTGSKSRFVERPLPADDPTQRQPDISLAKKELGWEPKIALREGLEKTIDWFKSVKLSDYRAPTPNY